MAENEIDQWMAARKAAPPPAPPDDDVDTWMQRRKAAPAQAAPEAPQPAPALQPIAAPAPVLAPEGTRRRVAPQPLRNPETPYWQSPVQPELGSMPAAPKPPEGWDQGYKLKPSDLLPDPILAPQIATQQARILADALTRPPVQAPAPPGLQQNPPSDASDVAKMSYEAKYGMPAPENLGTAFREPAQQIAGGVEQIADAKSGKDVASGVSGVLRGGVGAISSGPAIAPMIAAAPVGAPLVIAGSMLAKEGTQAALKKAKVPKEYAELAGDVVGLVVAGGGARYLIGKADAAIAEHNAVAERMLSQEQTAGRVQSAMDDVFAGDRHEIRINGKPATLEYAGASTSGQASLKGRPLFRVLDADGKQMTAGTGPEVQAWLAARGAVAAPLSEPPAIVQQASAKPAAAQEVTAKPPVEPKPEVAAKPEVPSFDEFVKGEKQNAAQPEPQPGAAAPQAQPQGGSTETVRPTRGAEPGVEPGEKPPVIPAAAAQPNASASGQAGQPAAVANGSGPEKKEGVEPTDPLAWAKQQIAAGEKVSTSQLQRKFRLGYGAASKVLDQATAKPEQKAEAAAPATTQVSAPAAQPTAADRQPGWVGNIPTSEIQVDAPRFQFKRNVGQGGAGEELREVTQWDPEKAGVTAVWKDPADNKTYVVNGHNRLAMANRLEVPEMTVRYLKARTAQEARLKGALINIAEGRGDSLDAAKVFRDTGMGPEALKAEGVSLKGKVASEGLALSRLAQPLFQEVLDGGLTPARGAVIGEGVPNHADQQALYRILQQQERGGKRLTNDQVEELIRLNGRTATTTERTDAGGQSGLFGEEEITRSLLPEKAVVSDYVRQQLRSEKKLFGAVSSQAAAEKLNEAGNVIKTGENAAVAERANQGIALYDKLSAKAGPIDGILDRAAQQLANGENANDAKQSAYREVRDHLARQIRQLSGVPEGSAGRAEGLGNQGPLETGQRQQHPPEVAPHAVHGVRAHPSAPPAPLLSRRSSEGSPGAPSVEGLDARRPGELGARVPAPASGESGSRRQVSHGGAAGPERRAAGGAPVRGLAEGGPEGPQGGVRQDAGEGLFGAGEEQQSRLDKQRNENQLLHDQLTAQIHSGMAAKPANLRPVQTRGLFEEAGPEQEGLFGGQPAQDLSVPHDRSKPRPREQVFSEAKWEAIPASSSRPPLLRVNAQALDAINDALGGAPRGGAQLTAGEATKMAAVLRDRADLLLSRGAIEFPTLNHLSALASAIEHSADPKSGLIYYQSDSGVPRDKQVKILREEYLHARQSQIQGDAAKDRAVQSSVLDDPLFAKAWATLEKVPLYAGAPDRTKVNEVTAKLGAGLHAQLGLTLKEGADLLDRYLSALEAAHGSMEVGRMLAHIARPLRSQIYDRRTARQIQRTVQAELQRRPSPGGTDAAPEVLRGLEEGRQERPDEADDTEPPGEPGAGQAGRPLDFDTSIVLGSGLGALQPVIEKFWERDLGPVLKETAQTFAESADDILKVLAPQLRSESAQQAGLILRHGLAELARKFDRSEAALRGAAKLFDRMPLQERYDFIDRVETHQTQKTPELEQIAKVFRAMLDARRATVQALGTGKLQKFYTDYFPHIWKKPKQAGNFFATFFGRRPLEGGKSFLKQRTLPTFADGLKAGLEPVSENPVDLVIAKVREMDRYVLAHQVLNEWKQAKLARFVDARQGHAPAGWRKIEDPIGTVYGPSIQNITEYPNEGLWKGLQAVANALGIKQERGFLDLHGAIGRASRTGTVKTLHGTAEDVLAHEIGHQIDFLAGSGKRFVLEYPDPQTVARLKRAYATLKDKSTTVDQRRDARNELVSLKGAIQQRKTFQKELRDLADLRSGSASYTHKREEKMAQLAEMWVGSRELFQRTAPTVFREWKQFLDQNPKLHALRDIEGNTEVTPIAQPYDVGGLVIKGHWWAPEGAARILNNYLSPGLRAKSGAYRILLGANNVLNQFQLGLSAFHLGFTSADAAVSKGALAIEQALRGKPLEALKSAATVPAAPLTTYLQGSKVLDEWYKPGSQGGPIAAIVDALEKGGGRARMDAMYQTHIGQQMQRAFREGNLLGGMLRAPFAAVEGISNVIMSHVVPRQKLGVFADLARLEMERLGPNATLEETRAAMAKVWDSVENRMGQLTYDNLFWDRTAKDLAMLIVRSVGWNLGTVREIGGGGLDFARLPFQLAGKGGGPDKINIHRMSYIVSLTILSAIAGALYQYLSTGEGPKELKDYFFPRTGELDEAGRPQRMSLPTYVKDVYHYGTEPGKTLANKIAPIWSLFGEMIHNRDFYGTEIRHPDDPIVQQMLEVAKHVVTTAQPFGFRNLERETKLQAPMFQRVQGFFGITPAPASLEKTKAELLASEISHDRTPPGTRTKEQAAKREEEGTIRRLARLHKPIGQEVSDAIRNGTLTRQDVKRTLQSARLSPLERAFHNMPWSDALRVFKVADAGEKQQLRALLAKKGSNALKAAAPIERPAILKDLREALGQVHSGGHMSGPFNTERKPNPSNPYDRAAMEITHTTAQSRFTRSPITIGNDELAHEQIAAAARRPGSTVQKPGPLNMAGDDFQNEGFQQNGKIAIGLHGTPAYRDMQNILHHEDIHALLEQNHEPVRVLGGPVDAKVRAAFRKARPGQDPGLELPSYMAAFKPGDIPGVTREDRNLWIKQFLPTLKESTRKTFVRIMASHEASQSPEFGGGE